MQLRRSILLLPALFAAFALAPSALAAGSCGRSAYSYAGFDSPWRAYGVGAQIMAAAAPDVVSGHVAGWVGVGGPGLGPGGRDEWLQVGLAGDDLGGDISTVYYEVTTPWSGPKFWPITTVKPGVRHRLAVLEMAHRRSYWRVWMDGRAVTGPIYLPKSHGAWAPQVYAESWNGGNAGVCNRYAYRFDNVVVARGPGGAWKGLRKAARYADAGYRVSGGPARFLASSS